MSSEINPTANRKQQIVKQVSHVTSSASDDTRAEHSHVKRTWSEAGKKAYHQEVVTRTVSKQYSYTRSGTFSSDNRDRQMLPAWGRQTSIMENFSFEPPAFQEAESSSGVKITDFDEPDKNLSLTVVEVVQSPVRTETKVQVLTQKGNLVDLDFIPDTSEGAAFSATEVIGEEESNFFRTQTIEVEPAPKLSLSDLTNFPEHGSLQASKTEVQELVMPGSDEIEEHFERGLELGSRSESTSSSDKEVSSLKSEPLEVLLKSASDDSLHGAATNQIVDEEPLINFDEPIDNLHCSYNFALNASIIPNPSLELPASEENPNFEVAESENQESIDAEIENVFVEAGKKLQENWLSKLEAAEDSPDQAGGVSEDAVENTGAEIETDVESSELKNREGQKDENENENVEEERQGPEEVMAASMMESFVVINDDIDQDNDAFIPSPEAAEQQPPSSSPIPVPQPEPASPGGVSPGQSLASEQASTPKPEDPEETGTSSTPFGEARRRFKPAASPSVNRSSSSIVSRHESLRKSKSGSTSDLLHSSSVNFSSSQSFNESTMDPELLRKMNRQRRKSGSEPVEESFEELQRLKRVERASTIKKLDIQKRYNPSKSEQDVRSYSSYRPEKIGKLDLDSHLGSMMDKHKMGFEQKMMELYGDKYEGIDIDYDDIITYWRNRLKQKQEDLNFGTGRRFKMPSRNYDDGGDDGRNLREFAGQKAGSEKADSQQSLDPESQKIRDLEVMFQQFFEDRAEDDSVEFQRLLNNFIENETLPPIGTRKRSTTENDDEMGRRGSASATTKSMSDLPQTNVSTPARSDPGDFNDPKFNQGDTRSPFSETEEWLETSMSASSSEKVIDRNNQAINSGTQINQDHAVDKELQSEAGQNQPSDNQHQHITNERDLDSTKAQEEASEALNTDSSKQESGKDTNRSMITDNEDLPYESPVSDNKMGDPNFAVMLEMQSSTPFDSHDISPSNSTLRKPEPVVIRTEGSAEGEEDSLDVQELQIFKRTEKRAESTSQIWSSVATGSTGEEEISAPTSAFSDGGTEVKSSGGEEHQTAGELEGSKNGRAKHSEELQAKNKDSDQGDSEAADSTVDLQDPLDPPGLFPGQSNRPNTLASSAYSVRDENNPPAVLEPTNQMSKAESQVTLGSGAGAGQGHSQVGEKDRLIEKERDLEDRAGCCCCCCGRSSSCSVL